MLLRLSVLCLSLSQSALAFTPSRIFSRSLVTNLNMSDSVGLTDIGKENVDMTSSSTESITSWREKITTSIARSRKVRGGNYVQIASKS